MNSISDSTILIADDNNLNIIILTEILRREGYKVLSAHKAEDAFELAQKSKPDLFLLDVMLPDIDGFDLAIMIKSDPVLNDKPIMFISALTDLESKMRGFGIGAVDYIIKPFQKEEVKKRVYIHLKLHYLELEQERNIKKLKQREIRLKALNKQKDDILKIVSHDMRNPLNGIIGISNLLKEDLKEQEEAAMMLGLIEDSGEKLLSLVNDLLDVAAIESGRITIEPKVNNIANTLKSCIDLYDPTARLKKVKLDCECSKTLTGYYDDSKLSQSINNLISNSIKFCNEGDTITISAEENQKNELVINVTDTGIGIPKKHLPVLFKKFGEHTRYGTKGEKSTGLGLPIVKKFVELHKGKIDIISEVGNGTTFTIILPPKP